MIDLPSLFALRSAEAIEEILPATQMVVIVIALGLLAGVVQRAFSALQEGFCVAAIQVVSRLVLIMLFVVVDLKMGLPALVFVVGGLPNAGLLLVGFPVLFIRHKWLVPARV